MDNPEFNLKLKKFRFLKNYKYTFPVYCKYIINIIDLLNCNYIINLLTLMKNPLIIICAYGKEKGTKIEP